MKKLILTPKFKRSFRKFTRRNARLKKTIAETLKAVEADVFASHLGTHTPRNPKDFKISVIMNVWKSKNRMRLIYPK